jgi:RNA polymerase sigma-70 factor (ECF subfamily)
MTERADALSEDAQLVAQARNGDTDSFRQLYEKHKGAVYRTALGITKDASLAEEIQQDCFLRAHDHLDNLCPRPSIGPWLRRVTINLSLNRLRGKQARIVPLENASYALGLPAALSADEMHSRKELAATVRQGLKRLSARHRQVLVLHYLQGFSVDEIADVMECPAGTVKSRLYYARRRLQKTLRENQTPIWVQA